MEVLFWVGMYVLASLIFYLFLIWEYSPQQLRFNDEDFKLALFSFLWPVFIVLIPFKLVAMFHEYIKTRKKAQ